MNEAILHVIQALETKSFFIYILQQSEIDYLKNKGYSIIVKPDRTTALETDQDEQYTQWLFDCIIRKSDH